MYAEKLKEIVTRVSPSAASYTGTQYVSDGILESVEIMEIVSEIEEAFDLIIGPEYILPEYFESVETLEKLVRDVQECG